MGNAKLNSWMQWVLLVCVIATLVIAYGAYDKANTIEVPTVDEIIAQANIPSAAEIAGLIQVPAAPEAPEFSRRSPTGTTR